MAEPRFRAFVWRLLGRCHVYELSADPGNPHRTYLREGERNVGLGLVADILRLCPEHYETMSREGARRTRELNDG